MAHPSCPILLLASPSDLVHRFRVGVDNAVVRTTGVVVSVIFSAFTVVLMRVGRGGWGDGVTRMMMLQGFNVQFQDNCRGGGGGQKVVGQQSMIPSDTTEAWYSATTISLPKKYQPYPHVKGKRDLIQQPKMEPPNSMVPTKRCGNNTSCG